MKKLVLGSLVLSTALFGGGFHIDTPMGDFGIDLGEKKHHHTKNNKTSGDVCTQIVPQCFNAYNVEISTPTKEKEKRIQTQTAGSLFTLQVTHKKECGLGFDDISIGLIDNKTGELITDLKGLSTKKDDETGSISFEVDGAYRDVSVGFFNVKPTSCESNHGFKWMYGFSNMFQYMQNHSNMKDLINVPFLIGGELECHEVTMGMFNWEDKVIDCPSDINDIKTIKNDFLKDFTSFHHSFKYAVAKNGRCYTISNSCNFEDGLITKSSDNFAIKPAKFEVSLPTNIGSNVDVPVEVKVYNAKNEVIDTYEASSTDLKVKFVDGSGSTIEAQYGFDVTNGVGSGVVNFTTSANGVSMIVEDEHFADVDKDDTSSLQRSISSASSSSTNVKNSNISKYWAGTGTNEKENDPMDNTVDVNIKQNTKKDLHYQKMNW